MPRKFQPITIENQTEEELEIRKELAMKKLEVEVRLLKIRYERHEKSYKEIDDTMKNTIETTYDESTAEYLKDEWLKEVNEEEQKSEELFSRNEEWYNENLTDEPRPGKNPKNNSELQTYTDNSINRRNETVTANTGNTDRRRRIHEGRKPFLYQRRRNPPRRR